MARPPKLFSQLFVVLLFLTVTPHLLCFTSGDIPLDELNAATAALRSAGYDLFANALSVSDVLYQILGGDEFTLLSPPDPSLFSLDMAVDSFRYVHSLRIHVLARRLSLTDLRNISLSKTPFVDSLSLRQPPLALAITTPSDNHTSGAGSGSVTVEGVRILWPDIFVGPHLAVHGLEGSLIGKDLLSAIGGSGWKDGPPPSSSPSFPEKYEEESAPSISFPPQNLGFYSSEGSPSPSPSFSPYSFPEDFATKTIPSSQDSSPTSWSSGVLDQSESFSSSTTLPPIDAVFSPDLTNGNSISPVPNSQGSIPVSAPAGFRYSSQSAPKSSLPLPRKWFPAERVSPGYPTILSPWIDRIRKGDKSYIRGRMSPQSSETVVVANSPSPHKQPDFVLSYPVETPPLTQSDAVVSYPAHSPSTQTRSDSVVSYPANSPAGVKWGMPRRSETGKDWSPTKSWRESDWYVRSPTGSKGESENGHVVRRKRSRRRRHHHHHHDPGHKGL